MEEHILKAVASLLTPVANEGVKKLFHSNSKAGDALTAALTENLASVIKEADSAEIARRMLAKEQQIKLRKQFNFENVAALAIELASLRPAETRRPIDEDWFLRWFEAAEEVSDSTVQMLWARAFDQQADENKRQISLRAIETLRLMERRDVLNFRRAVDVFDQFGVVTVSSIKILQGLMRGHDLDSLVDQNLLTVEEYQLSNISVPGGFSVYFKLPEGLWAPDPIRQYRLSARARELANTLPDSIVFSGLTEEMFDVTDPLVTARYLNIFADGLDNRYEVMLAIHPYEGKRPPPAGIKRTHIWEHIEKRWIRVNEPQCAMNPNLMAALEGGYGIDAEE